MCERIFKTPMPLSFTRLTSRFLSVWTLALPFALYGAITPHWLIVPITAFIAFFVFGIEEIGLQIEEPFSALALNAMADGIDASIFEALEMEKKDPFMFEPRGGWKRADAQPRKIDVSTIKSTPSQEPKAVASISEVDVTINEAASEPAAAAVIEAEPELVAASMVSGAATARAAAVVAAPAPAVAASPAPATTPEAPAQVQLGGGVTVLERTPEKAREDGKRTYPPYWPRHLIPPEDL
mmetsp:Transcript_19535/g.55388  ORF Transcript_19535/g.55388 Transcript_19535/m.55388 type:complete len:239 (-) Transcript_19535:330-1046(-)